MGLPISFNTSDAEFPSMSRMGSPSYRTGRRLEALGWAVAMLALVLIFYLGLGQAL
jgi:hypothetical protein